MRNQFGTSAKSKNSTHASALRTSINASSVVPCRPLTVPCSRALQSRGIRPCIPLKCAHPAQIRPPMAVAALPGSGSGQPFVPPPQFKLSMSKEEHVQRMAKAALIAQREARQPKPPPSPPAAPSSPTTPSLKHRPGTLARSKEAKCGWHNLRKWPTQCGLWPQWAVRQPRLHPSSPHAARQW